MTCSVANRRLRSLLVGPRCWARLMESREKKMCALTSRPSRRRLKAGSRGCLNKGLRANMWADADRISWHCQVRSACVCSAIFELPLSSLWTASSVAQKKLNNEPYSRLRSDAQVPGFFLEYTRLANATSSVFPVCLGAHCFPESLVLYDWIFCVCVAV